MIEDIDGGGGTPDAKYLSPSLSRGPEFHYLRFILGIVKFFPFAFKCFLLNTTQRQKVKEPLLAYTMYSLEQDAQSELRCVLTRGAELGS